MKSHYPLLVEYADKGIPALLKKQCLDVMSPEYGGFPEPRKGYTEPSHGISVASTLAILYHNKDSAWHRNEELLDRALLACDYTLRKMHRDGTIDLVETNFHDATSVGFTIWNVSPAFRVMRKFSEGTEKEALLETKFLEFMQRGADGMKNGGFHTPNHRWVMASAMALLSNDLGRPDLIPEIDLYINEGIDCNPDGEYSERSTGIYNVVNNKGLLVVAEELGRWELLEHVERNLYMMFTYLEPDDTILTINSRRQDFGKELYPFAYYENYLMAAHYLGNAHFAHLADYFLDMTNRYVKDKSPLSILRFPKPLALYMLNDKIRETELEKTAFDMENYEHFYRESGIVRIRKGNISTTVLANNDVFFKLQNGNLSVFARFAASFFGNYGRFIPESIEKTGNGYRLHYHSDRGYVRPLGKPGNVIKDGRINTEGRDFTHMQEYDVTMDITPVEDGADIHISSKGVENLPCKLELIFPPDGYFDSEQAQFKASQGQHVMLKYGSFEYTRDDDVLRVEGAFGGNTAYHHDLRGSLPQESNAFTVYFTDFSPTEKSVRIRGK
ncbi:MAG: hypothetical protein R6W96_05345 [Clostridia bacterium]